ncbi:hypothetical protein D5085_12265 [Ectothiorhodospiraceae bacterium BW-2]|nr:hypothetical protein D5085_12265 [Ectothiorhodospiraceae bacterium BW-2]
MNAKQKADINRLAYIGSKPGLKKSSDRDSDAWFTPSLYTDMAREVMGEIDLDPFSSATANAHVRAKRFFDPTDDAFNQEWFRVPGRVFMNPPYGRRLINAAVDLFLDHWHQQRVCEAIVLVNNSTETRWFHALLHSATSLCLPDRRIAFENDDGKFISGNTRGQVFFYFGARRARFGTIFSRIGVVLATNTSYCQEEKR